MSDKDQKQHHHHILPDSVALTIGGTLLVLTVVTVAVAYVDLGSLNFVVALAVATHVRGRADHQRPMSPSVDASSPAALAVEALPNCPLELFPQQWTASVSKAHE